MLIAAPIGLLSARSTSPSTPARASASIVKPILEILAGIPSVVLGFFALTFINPNVVQALFPTAKAFNLLAAGIGVGILTIPLVASDLRGRDARRARSPCARRRTASARGGSRPVVRVVVPAAISGIVAALILGDLAGHRRDDGRGHRRRRDRRLAVHARTRSGPGQTHDRRRWPRSPPAATRSQGSTAAFQSLFFLGLLLFLMTLGLNVVGDAFVRRTRQTLLGRRR